MPVHKHTCTLSVNLVKKSPWAVKQNLLWDTTQIVIWRYKIIRFKKLSVEYLHTLLFWL